MKNLKEFLLGLVFVVCVYIVIQEIGFWIWFADVDNPRVIQSYDSDFIQMQIIFDSIVIFVSILSGVRLKKLIFPNTKKDLRKTESEDSPANFEEYVKNEKKKRFFTRVLILLYFLVAIVVANVMSAVVDKPCIVGLHDQNGQYVVRESTCSVPGEAIVVCTMCNKEFDTISLSLSEVNHNWSEFEVVTKVRGCAPGEQVRTCKECGAQESEEIEPTHYGEWKYAGRTETLFEYNRTCTRCGKEESKYEYRHKVKCKNCNGTGSVKYYYGSGDLEAILNGYDPYTFGPCTMCDETGYDYADYPWE